MDHPQPRHRPGRIVAVIGAGLVVIWIAAVTINPPTIRTSAASGPSADASAKVACREFARFGRDVREGVVAEYEVRGRTQKIYESGRVSDYPGLSEASRQLHAGATQRRPSEVSAAIGRLGDICGNVLR
jgi:hypothetical protein